MKNLNDNEAAAPAAIAIAGMGLIGGSFYKAAKRAGYDVVGFDKGDPVDVRDADVVFVAAQGTVEEDARRDENERGQQDGREAHDAPALPAARRV